MIRHRRLLFCVLLIIGFKINGYAQKKSVSDTLLAKLTLYDIKKTSPVLFLHFDKTIYTNSESVWFTGYVFNCDTAVLAAHRILSLALVNDADNSIIAQESFPIQNGLCFGNMVIPDTILAGNYTFTAVTDLLSNNQPELVFKQAVTLKNTAIPEIKLALSLTDTPALSGTIKTTLHAANSTGPLTDADITYSMGDVLQPALAAKAKTDNTGTNTFSFDAKKVSSKGHVLKARVRKGKLIEEADIDIVPARKIAIKFYPEGGYLVAGKNSKVGWEAKGTHGEPLRTDAVLFKNDKPVDTIATDSYGMGTFSLTPQKDALYKVKIKLPGVRDTAYKLPVALSQGVVVNVENALDEESLTLKIQSNSPQTYHVLVHNYREVFYSFDADKSIINKPEKIDLSTIPRGLAIITVLDNAERPVAERLFFPHFYRKPKLEISTDKNAYNTRQKVSLKIKLNSLAGDAADGGNISVACIQDNRMAIGKENNIESYYYLNREINNLPQVDNLMDAGLTDKHYVEELLLIKGWTRYTWPELLGTKPADTVKNYKHLNYSGNVTYADKPLKKPMELTSIRDTLTGVIHTDNSGIFTLQPEAMLVTPGKKAVFFMSGKSKTDPYVIHINNPFTKTIEDLIRNDQQTNTAPILPALNNQTPVLEGFERSISLTGVKITDKKDNSLFATSANNGVPVEVNECGDFKCVNNILNCGYHGKIGSFGLPKKGEYVRVFQNGKLVDIIYRGCIIYEKKQYSNIFITKGIYTEKEFYGASFDDTSSSVPEYQSTLFWKHNVTINTSGEAEFSFFTNDVTGKFRVIAQGITNEDVVYGQYLFHVKGK